MTYDEVLTHFENVRRRGTDRAMASCPNPGHGNGNGDRSQSLGIDHKPGKTVIYCHATCETQDVLAAAKPPLTEADLFDSPRPASECQGRGPCVGRWDYEESAGKIRYQERRYQHAGSSKKTFLPFRPDGKGEWICDLEGVTRIPYRLPELTAASPDEPIFILEGEKKADLARAKLRIVATCNCGGTGGSAQWKTPAFQKAVKGRNVIISPDHDEPGERHAEAVAAAITGVAKSVKIVRLPLKNTSDDVVEWIEAGGTREQLDALVAAAPLWTPQASAATAETPAEVLPASRCLATVEPRPVKWLWFGRLASGEMIVITGPPGAGKGLLCCYVVAHFTTGRPMEGDRQACPAGHVLIVSSEDDDSTALVPRHRAAGADMDRVHSWIMDAPPTLPDDTDRIVAEIDRVHAEIVILDPAPTLLTREFSSNSDADVRRAYGPLASACRARGVALILIRHTNKRQLGDAMARGGGSIGWSGMARIELMLGRRPPTDGATVDNVDDASVILAPVKSNLGKWPRSLHAQIVEAGDSARMEFLGVSDATADDLCAQDRPRMARKTEDAEALLRRVLGDFEWHLQKEIDLERKAADISYSTLNRVKADLDIECRQRAKNVWEWRLPRQIVIPPDTCNLTIRQCDLASGSDVDNLTSNNSSSLESSDSQDVRLPHTPPGGDLTTDGAATGAPSAAGVLGNCTRVRPDSAVTPADVEALQAHLAGLNGTAEASVGRLWAYWKGAPQPSVAEFLAREKGGAHA